MFLLRRLFNFSFDDYSSSSSMVLVQLKGYRKREIEGCRNDEDEKAMKRSKEQSRDDMESSISCSSLAESSLDTSFISTSIHSRESSPFDVSIASEESAATITQMEALSLRSTPTIASTLTLHRKRQPSRPYRILSHEDSVALLVAQSTQAVAEVKSYKMNTKILKRKSNKKEKIPSGVIYPSYISCPAPPLIPSGRQLPSPLCCPNCASLIGQRLSAPSGITLIEPLSTRSESSYGEESNHSMNSSFVSTRKDEDGTRLSFLSSSTGYSSARSSLRSNGEESPGGETFCVSESSQIRSEVLSRSPISQLDRICVELLDTERTFVADLNDIIQGYLNFMVSHRESLGVTVNEISSLFGCIERIFALNRTLFVQLDAAKLDAAKMCQCFIDNASRFDDYVTYCTNYQRMLSTLCTLSSRPSVSSALKERQISLGHPLPLSAYLLKPVQRILKYHLFIENILRELESSNAVEEKRRVARKALDEMTSQASRMNDEKKKSEHAERVDQLQRILTQWSNQQTPDLTAYGELLLEAQFRLSGAKTMRQLFLFEEMLLIAKQRSGHLVVKDFIMCSNLMLNESISSDPLSFQVLSFDSPRAQYVFLANNTEQKKVWMRELKRAVLDHFEVEIPEETKRLMLSIDNTQVKIPFGRPEFADVKQSKKIPKYLEKRRKSVESRDRRRSLSTSRLAPSNSQNSITPKSSTPSNHKCTCGMEPMSSGITHNRALSSSTMDFNESLPAQLNATTPSPSSSFSFFSRKKSTPTSESGRGRFFQARKTRQLPPTGRDEPDRSPWDSPSPSSLNTSAPTDSITMNNEEIEKSFDEIYRNLQLFGAEQIEKYLQVLPNREDASRRLDNLVKGKSPPVDDREKRLRSKSLSRLDAVNVGLEEANLERFEKVGGWEPTERQQRIRMSRNTPAPLARFDQFDSTLDSSPSPIPFSLSHPPSRPLLSFPRQRSPLSSEQCRMIDTALIHPDIAIVRHHPSQIEKA
ncbi:uig-1 [Pristionchus pacificus]|uniref:Uig-1 n=1 Tax=Pristionchus pacificus TaxID=54126 RepID=A0A2A6CSS8_PRIPA|nr:uig-1 [Pristionchus pacificus]|eukprot:PDM81274.1 uig-1 [Pristionchus pacificus]